MSYYTHHEHQNPFTEEHTGRRGHVGGDGGEDAVHDDKGDDEGRRRRRGEDVQVSRILFKHVFRTWIGLNFNFL